MKSCFNLFFALIFSTLTIFNTSITANPLTNIDTVTLQLKWKHQFQFAGYYAAISKGYYKDAGLYVKIKEAVTGDEVIPSLINGEAQFGVAASDLLLLYNSGSPVVLLANIFQHSPNVFLSLVHNESDNVHDIAGNSIMLEEHADELLAYLKLEQIPIEKVSIIPHTFSPEALIHQQVFAMSAYSTDEPFLLQELDIDYNIFNPRSSGIDFYGDVLFTTKDEIDKHPERVKKFLDASLLGWEYALSNESEIVELIYEKYSQRHSIDHLLYEAAQTKRLIMPDVIEIGYINKNRWERIGEIYSELNMLPESFSVDNFIYDRYPESKHYVTYLIIIGILIATFLILIIAINFYRLNRKLTIESFDRQKRENKLILLEERYRNLVNYAPIPIFITSPITGEIMYINQQASEKFELDSNYAIEKNVSVLYVNPTDRVATIDKLKQHGYIRDRAIRMKNAGGKEFWAIVTSNIVTFDDKQAIFSAIHDISDRINLENKLKSANVYKNKLFSIISHDLKGPVGTLNSFLEILVENQYDINSEKHREILSKLYHTSKTTFELLDNLLLWSLSQKDEIIFNPENNNIYELIQSNIKLLAQNASNKGISFVLNCDKQLTYNVDSNLIMVVIRNLIANAIKYSHTKGEITITANQQIDSLKISIADQGVGIDSLTVKKILHNETVVDSKIGTQGESGTGLGLLICSDFIKIHRGKIWAESELGKGSAFYFTIPK